jgi:hypothetical protein
MSMSLIVYLSVADAARDDVLLHVPSSSERQERKNKTGTMKKRIPFRHKMQRCESTFL